MGNLLSLRGGVLVYEFDWQEAPAACAAPVRRGRRSGRCRRKKSAWQCPVSAFDLADVTGSTGGEIAGRPSSPSRAWGWAGRRSGAACIPWVSISLRRPVLAATLQGSIMTFVSLRLDWAAEARRAAALLASHTTGARDIEAAPLRPGKAGLANELDA